MAKAIRKYFALSLLLACGIANASTAAPRYEGMFETKATAYNGVSFDRHFKVSVHFMPRTDIIATAKVREQRVCANLDECYEGDAYENQCNTYVKFDLGKVLIRVRDIETGETVSEILPWSAQVENYVRKNEDEPCAPSDLEGQSVAGSVNHLFVLKSAVPGIETSLFIEIETNAAWKLPSELAMASTIHKMSGDTYYVAPFSPNAQENIFWQYAHARVWEVSNFAVMKLKN